jgi:NADH-quinone oxidoreductase subunit N
MDLHTLLSFEWKMMTPEFIIVLAAVLLSLLDLFAGKRISRQLLAYIGLGAVILALASLILLYNEPVTEILYGTFRLDSFAKAFKTLLLAGAALVFFLAMSDTEKDPITDQGEYYYLFLTALLGGMFMASSSDLITLFVGLELLSLSSFVLVGIRKRNEASNEAAMKYVINGGISTAITLFGMSYLYGVTGTTNIIKIQGILVQSMNTDIAFLLSLAFLLMFVGLCFKLAAAPFHMWAPDVYQGAPTPVTAFLGAVSKIAGFVIIMRIFLSIFAGIPDESGMTSLFADMKIYIAVLAGITMVVGNTIALKQNNVKRLFAYSSIAHAGYLLVPFVALSPFMLDSMWVYMLAYLLMNIGAFAIIHGLLRQSDSENLEVLAGLYHRSPFAAIMMTVFILSLAGFPGTAGFIGKVNIFLGAFVMQPAHYVLASVMMATTVVSFFYYFRVLQQMFFRKGGTERIRLPWNLTAVIVICAAGTVLFGILPALGYDFFFTNFDFRDFMTQGR